LLSIPFSLSFAIYEAGGFNKLLQSISTGRRYYCVVVPVQAVIDIGFTLSFVYTSAAVALLLINLNPLWGAIIGKIVLNDVLPIRTYVALVLALECMMIIFVPEVVSGEQNETTSSLKGNMFSLFTGFMLAVYLSIVRKAGQDGISLVGGTPLGAAISTIVSAIVTRGQVLPSLFWDIEMWKFWLAVIAQGFGIGIIFITMVSIIEVMRILKDYHECSKVCTLTNLFHVFQIQSRQ
jgi:drug/metabolite transporter (DMT)-like permease